MKATPIRTNPDTAHTVAAVFATFPPCAETLPNRQAAATRAETLARETAARLFTERDTCLGQVIARVHPPVPPRKPAGRNAAPLIPTAEELRETAWRKRLMEAAWVWTRRTDCRMDTALKTSEGQVWLPMAALELACLEGFAVREVQPLDGAGGVFPAGGAPEGFPRAELSTPQPQPSTEEIIYA